MRKKIVCEGFFSFPLLMNVFPHCSSYPLSIHVGRKQTRREWEKKSKRRELEEMNDWVNTRTVLAEEMFLEKEIEFKLSLFTKPQPWLCCQRALLAERGDTAQASPGSLLIVSGFVCTYVMSPWVGLHLAPQSLIAPSSEPSLSRTYVTLLEHVNGQICICWLVIYFAFLLSKPFCI